MLTGMRRAGSIGAMSRAARRIGPVRPKAGSVVRGHLDVLVHPSGQPERLPLIVVRGRRPGPTRAVTANIHGPELTGLHVLHDLCTPALARALAGTVVALPSLNPTGLTTNYRQSMFDPRDPNRLFPDPRPRMTGRRTRTRTRPIDAVTAPPGHRRGETVMQRVYDLIRAHADAYLDLHTATTWSVPLTLLDPVFYAPREQRASRRLFARTRALAQAIGLTVVREEPPPRYFDRHMHRTSTGAVLNGARIPALTLELGMTKAVDPAGHAAGLRALRNALRHLGMLEGDLEPHTGLPVVSRTGTLRGLDHPRAGAAGVVRYHVRPGQAVRAGERIATIRRLDGRTAPGGVVRTELDGTVLWLRGEGATYPGTPLALFGIEDDLPMVLPWPKP